MYLEYGRENHGWTAEVAFTDVFGGVRYNIQQTKELEKFRHD